MENGFRTYSLRHLLVLMISLAAALLSIWSLSLQMEVRKISIELEHEKNKDQEKSKQDHVFIQEYQAATNPVQLHHDLSSILPERIHIDLLLIYTSSHIILPVQERLFKTLFRHIIAPNAP